MQQLAIDHCAMNIPLTAEEFAQHKQSNWKKVDIGGQVAWWCGETGFFYEQNDGSYAYIESNVWGSLNE